MTVRLTRSENARRALAGPAAENQPLWITIECTPTAADRFGTPHRVLVRPDWSVEAPHDLDAERVARSLGGWCSCLHFTERVVPAFRRALQAMRAPGRLPFDGHRWRNRTILGAGDERWTREDGDPWEANDSDLEPASRFLANVVRREISPEHQLRRPATGLVEPAIDEAEERMYKELFIQAGRNWSARGDPRYIDDGAEGYLDLWEHGVLPTQVAEIARSLPRESWPLPQEFYLKAHFDDIDPDWLTNVISCYPTRDFAIWAVGQGDRYWERYPAETVWRMYELGIGDRDAIGALDAEVPIQSLAELANRPGISGTSAARWLTIWSKLGVVPSSIHYRLLEAHRVLLERPAPWLLDWTANALRKFGPSAPSRTELAVMLALTPDVGMIEEAVRRGIQTATDVRFIQLVNQPAHQRKRSH